MIKGDPGMESIYKWTQDEMNIKTRGALGRADGASAHVAIAEASPPPPSPPPLGLPGQCWEQHAGLA